MKVISWEELREGKLGGVPCAATIGVFDGLHNGHRELVGRILKRDGVTSVVLTFKENPKWILSPSTHAGELSTLDQKLGLIASMGVDISVLIDFSGDFSKLPGRRFLTILKESGELRYLAVGSDFRCGKGLDTTAEDIRAFCEANSIAVELIPAVKWSGHPVSSSRIRKAILDGRLEDAASMLGRPYEIDLRSAGSQARPPQGTYDACLVFPAGSGPAESRVSARIDAEGRWSFDRAAEIGKPEGPVGLGILRLVSRV
jgi:riboflavin kinase/FMN adenylyltransferase